MDKSIKMKFPFNTNDLTTIFQRDKSSGGTGIEWDRFRILLLAPGCPEWANSLCTTRLPQLVHKDVDNYGPQYRVLRDTDHKAESAPNKAKPAIMAISQRGEAMRNRKSLP